MVLLECHAVVRTSPKNLINDAGLSRRLFCRSKAHGLVTSARLWPGESYPLPVPAFAALQRARGAPPVRLRRGSGYRPSAVT
jgi:hypothetical protein